MKKIFRLVVLGLIVFFAWKYVQKNDIDVKQWLNVGVEWVSEKIDELISTIETEEDILTENSSDIQRIADNRQYQPLVSISNETEQLSLKQESVDAGERFASTTTLSTGSAVTYGASVSENQHPLIRENAYKDVGVGVPATNTDWVKAVTKKYSPVSWYLLMQYEALPNRAEALLADGGVYSSNKPVNTFHYLSGNNKIELMSSMETNVHELAHAYFSQNIFRYARENNLTLDWDKVQGYIFISPSESYFISFPKASLFPSREIASQIPDQLRTFRFATYIEGNSSTQNQGIIGLLDELHAYYQGSNYNYNMLDAYQNAEESDANGLLQWVSSTQSSMSAYYEFDFFIREYLLYMKRNYPGDYALLKSHNSFRKAYRAISSHFENLTVSYQELIQSEMKRLNESGQAEISIKDGWVWVKPGNSFSSKGVPVFSESREKLLVVLESERYEEIAGDFLINQ